MRQHLIDVHLDIWITMCEALGIEITTKKGQAALSKFNNSTRPKLTQPGSLPRQAFSPLAFKNALVDFIVADDQVRYIFMTHISF
jgi:hypothetical protein